MIADKRTDPGVCFTLVEMANGVVYRLEIWKIVDKSVMGMYEGRPNRLHFWGLLRLGRGLASICAIV